MRKMYIKGLKGEKIIVTDFVEAVKQTKWCVECHREAFKSRESGNNVIYYKDSHEYWEQIEKELIALGKKIGVDYDSI